MTHLTRIRIAALSAAFFLGGLTAAGFGIRAARDPAPAPITTRPRTQVVHQTRTRTVHVRAGRRSRSAGPPAQSVPAAAPLQQVSQAPVQAPAAVRSRVSPTGGEHEGDEDHEGETRDD